MKDKLTKVVSLAMVVAIIISMAMPFASAAKNEALKARIGVAATPVTGNADNAGFPKVLKEIGVNPWKNKEGYAVVYFNFQLPSSAKVKWVEAWADYSDDNKGFFKVAKRDTARNYMRYTSFEHNVYCQHLGATIKYYFVVQDMNGTQWTYPTKSAKVVWGW